MEKLETLNEFSEPEGREFPCYNFSNEICEDLSYSDLELLPEFLQHKRDRLVSLILDHNRLTVLPRAIASFKGLVKLDISNNYLLHISPEITQLQNLKTLVLKSNRLHNDSLPKEVSQMQSLEHVNLSGNNFSEFPFQLIDLKNLKSLYIGAANLREIPRDIRSLQRLEVLYLGGNKLEHIPIEVGFLKNLQSLILCDNRLESLPKSLTCLRNLKSLSLHNNRLSTLPPEIVTLNLMELSLRNNPLVVRFVQEMSFAPPSLLELAGRVVKIKSLKYTPEDLPATLIQYLDSANCCVNPKCKGVYFSSRVEHVKFVDFCGKYRLPLLEYLCSPVCKESALVCSSSSESESEEEWTAPVVNKMKKVLLPQSDSC